MPSTLNRRQPVVANFPHTTNFQSVEIDFVLLKEFTDYLKENNIDILGMNTERVDRTLFAYLNVDFTAYQQEQQEQIQLLDAL
jgi:hypothetical protein